MAKIMMDIRLHSLSSLIYCPQRNVCMLNFPSLFCFIDHLTWKSFSNILFSLRDSSVTGAIKNFESFLASCLSSLTLFLKYAETIASRLIHSQVYLFIFVNAFLLPNKKSRFSIKDTQYVLFFTFLPDSFISVPYGTVPYSTKMT